MTEVYGRAVRVISESALSNLISVDAKCIFCACLIDCSIVVVVSQMLCDPGIPGKSEGHEPSSRCRITVGEKGTIPYSR